MEMGNFSPVVSSVEVEKVRVCREAVGNDFDFVLEVHRGMTLAGGSCIWTCSRAIPPDDPGRSGSAGQCTIPWQRLHPKSAFRLLPVSDSSSLREFEVLMSTPCMPVCPPGCMRQSAESPPARRSAALAEAHDVLVIPHNPLRTGIHGSLPADLRIHSEPWDPGTPGLLLKWSRKTRW